MNKNIAIQSALYAVEQKTQVSMEHFVFATDREFNKMGRACMQNDFKDYFAVVESLKP